MRIGAIIPVREPAPYLSQALESVLAQDPPPDAHVVMHDRDGAGPAATRQRALAELDPTCDWVALQDADDVWEPGKLAIQREALARRPEAAVCVGSDTAIDRAGRPMGERLPHLPAGLHRPDELAPLLFTANPIPASSVLIRRDVLEAAGGFHGPARLASDWDLWLRLVAAGAVFVSEPRARVRRRRHPAAATADIAALAEAALAVHAAHAALVDDATRRRAESRDFVLLARGRIRQRRYAEAREALARAAAREPLGPRERLLRRLVAVPGVRGALGRRRPYR